MFETLATRSSSASTCSAGAAAAGRLGSWIATADNGGTADVLAENVRFCVECPRTGIRPPSRQRVELELAQLLRAIGRRAVEERATIRFVAGSETIQLAVGVDAVPDLMRRAVAAVPRATVVEVRADGAVIGRRTNMAIAAETTVLCFRATGMGTSEVKVISATRGFLGGMPRQRGLGELPETAKAVMAELQRLAVERGAC